MLEALPALPALPMTTFKSRGAGACEGIPIFVATLGSIPLSFLGDFTLRVDFGPSRCAPCYRNNGPKACSPEAYTLSISYIGKLHIGKICWRAAWWDV